MELDEFHVRYPAACPVGHGDTVTRGGVRVGGIEVDLAGAAGGDQRVRGADRDDLAGKVVQDIGSVAALVSRAELFAGNQVDGDMVFENGDVGVGADDDTSTDHRRGGDVDAIELTVTRLSAAISSCCFHYRPSFFIKSAMAAGSFPN